MRVTLRSVTHMAQWDEHSLVTDCGRRLDVPRCRKNVGTFWCRNEESTIVVDFDEPVDCMTCIVHGTRGG
jgi:hypothetical protein